MAFVRGNEEAGIVVWREGGAYGLARPAVGEKGGDRSCSAAVTGTHPRWSELRAGGMKVKEGSGC